MDIKKTLQDKDLLEVLRKGSVALFIRIFGFIAGYLFIYLIVKNFGAETQGRMSLSFSFMMIGALICRLGLDIHFVKVFAIRDNFQNAKGVYFKTVPLVFFLTTIVSCIVFLFSDFISQYFFNDMGLSIYLKWTAPCIIFFTFILLNAAIFRGLKKNTLYSFLFNGGRFVFALLFFLILHFAFVQDPISPIIAHSLSILLLFSISAFYIFKYIFPLNRSSNYSTKEFIRKSLPMLVSTSMIIFLGWTDTIILGIYKESSDVGIYSVILKVAVVTSFTFQAIDSILAPKLSTAYHNNDFNLFKSLIKYTTITNTVISVIIVIVIIVFRDFILNIFGKEFLYAGTALIILSLGQLTNAICGPVGSILQMTGRQLVFQNILILALVLNVTLNLLLVSSYGINGVATATAVSLAFWNITSLIYINKKIINF